MYSIFPVLDPIERSLPRPELNHTYVADLLMRRGKCVERSPPNLFQWKTCRSAMEAPRANAWILKK